MTLSVSHTGVEGCYFISLKHSSLKTPSQHFKQVHFDWTINQHLDDFTYFKLLYRFEVKRLEVCFSVFTGSLSEAVSTEV